MRVEMIAARPFSGAGTSEKTLAAERVWPSGARPAASLLIFDFEAAIAGKARQAARQAFFHLVFPARLSSRATDPS
jgi:hypothetical protein